MSNNIYLRPLRSKYELDETIIRINATSKSKNWQGLSPFYLKTEEDIIFENAYQFYKVYKQHLTTDNKITEEYFKWRDAGFKNKKPIRFPMGKGAKPEFSFYNNQRLSYVEARFQIYAPIYAKIVEKTETYKLLKKTYDENNICILDFDVYDYEKIGLQIEDCIYYPYRKFGHGFVLALMLLNKRVWDLPYDEKNIQITINKVNIKEKKRIKII